MNQEKVLEKDKHSHVQKLPHFFLFCSIWPPLVSSPQEMLLGSSAGLFWSQLLIQSLDRRYRFEFLAVIILKTHFQVQSHRKEAATSWFQGAKMS